MFDRTDEIHTLRRSLNQLHEQVRRNSTDPADAAWIERHLDELDARLQRIENSILFRTAREIGGFAERNKHRLGRWLLRSPLHVFYRKAHGTPDHVVRYRRWLAAQQTAEPSLQHYTQQLEKWSYQPVISILIPAHNPRREWFEAAVESVRRQIYPHWQLSIHDDGSSAAWLKPYLDELQRSDSRIRYGASPATLGISGALNKAADPATGDYLGFLDHDDALSPLALYRVVDALQYPDLPALLYTDDDTIDEAGQPLRPNFKPDWSPELLNSCMYMGHLLVVRRDHFERLGRFRSECDGSQDYDLALRITEGSGKITHIPHVLYHWRDHAASTARSENAKPYAREAGRRALESAVHRRNWKATVVDGALPNQFIVRRQIHASPQTSLIICSRSARLLKSCLGAVAKTTAYASREIVVVHHEPPDGTSAEARPIHHTIEQYGARRVAYPGVFNFALMNNLGAEAATGEILLFLNDDTAPLSAEWLSTLVAHLERPEIGVAGARLVYPDGLLQHAGITLGIGEGTGHPGRHLYASDFWPWLNYTRNVSAVTGACLGVRREVFAQLGGFDALFPVNYNDVDFCLRARQAGFEVIYDHTVLLRHDECRTRRAGTQPHERRAFFRRWGQLLLYPDPYYSPNLDPSNEAATLDVP